MTNPKAGSAPFPEALITARENADAAWDAEREAWEAIPSKGSPSYGDIKPWLDARDVAAGMQEVFELLLAEWRKQAQLP